jgi:hypothetical protein
MSCKRCDELLATYRREVTLFGNAVLKVAGAVGDDSRLASQEIGCLSQNCRDTSDALMEHWREHHGNVAPKPGS